MLCSYCKKLWDAKTLEETNNQNVDEILTMSGDDFTIHRKEKCFDGFFSVDKYEISHKKYDGGTTETFTREVFERGDAVVVIIYDGKQDKLILLEQFRAGAVRTQAAPWCLEFVAGMFNVGEKPEEVAIREAYEESGINIKPNQLSKIMTYLSSPGGISELIHLYIANVDIPEGSGIFGLDEEHEDILRHIVSREGALKLLKEGKIVNAATIIGLQWLALNYQSFGNKER